MISVSSEFTTALNSNNRLWQIKVQVTRNTSGATPVDISDRIISCDVDFDFDKRNAQASLQIDNYDYSLSPLNQSSTTNQVGGVYDPLLDSNHTLEIWYGLLTTSGYEYIKRFTGVLGDEIDADTYPGIIQLTSRDKAKLLQDAYIYQSKTYAPSGGTTLPLAENVMQDLINTFLPSGGITINVVNPTNYVVGALQPYTAQNVNVWDAMQTLSDAFNFSVMFDESGNCNMKNIVRDLSTVSSVYSFNETNLTKDRVSTNDSSVRNHIKLRVQGLSDVEKTNDNSINRYGRRYMEVHRSLSMLITEQAQAVELVDNMLKDLSFVHPVDNVEMPFFPLIQIGDIVSVTNSDLGTDSTTYRFRVTSIKDSFSKDKKRTTLDLQGYMTYSPATSPAPNSPTGLSGNTITRKIQNYTGSGWSGNSKTTYYPYLSWTPPTADVSGNALTNDFGGYTIYRKGVNDSGFYPIAAITSYIAATNNIVDYFYDYTAPTGNTQYYIKSINRTGQQSSGSATITVNKPADLIQ